MADPDAVGGARADGGVCLHSSPQVQFEGFVLAGGTPYAAVLDDVGNQLVDSVAVEPFGAGASGLTTLTFTDDRLTFWLAGRTQALCRIGLYTTEDGWLGFAGVLLHNMPVPPAEESGS